MAATSNTADSTNDDFSGVLFNHSQGPNVGGTFTSFGRIQFPIGIPIVSGAFSGDGTVSRTAAQFHGDYFYISTTVANRGALNGGSFDRGNASGRFAISLSTGVTSSSFSIGFRCGIAVD